MGVDPDRAGAALADLAACYSGPDRHHHDLAHAVSVRRLIEELATAEDSSAAGGVGVDDLRVAALAAWYHDAVYDPTAADNEARSAELARAALVGLGVPPSVAEQVDRVIRLTADHRVDPADRAAAILLDADLAILGAPPAVYGRYAAGIRAEFAAVPDDRYRAGRRAVLEGLLARPQLYVTREGRRRFDAAARANLRREIDALDDRGDP